MSSTTRVHKELGENREASQHREFMHALLTDLRALERMLAEGMFESGIRRIGAEQELFIVDETWGPAPGVLPMLERLGDPHFTTELGQFQIEANCDPQLLSGNGIAQLHAQLDALVDKARQASAPLGMKVVLMGILPTLRQSDLGLDNMVPSQRYMTLNRIVTELRGGTFNFAIKGLDELIIDHDSVMLEACNSSFQVHLQVGPDEFARMYNIAQVLAGPLMSVSCNSPIVFGKRLWAETRIALFKQAVDTRSQRNPMRETEARVSFGTRWVKESVAEIYREDIARFRALVGTELDEDPIAMLDAGEFPKLKALRLHNGTIYRWNRACFGVTDSKPHLRIENRIMPSGPSTIDQMANSAFWFGLMTEFGASGDDVTRRIDFDQAGNNFYTAAREGIGSHFEWLDGRQISAQRLVLDHLLATAEAGLNRAKVDSADIKRYLGVVEERARTGRTGAIWQSRSWNSLRDRGTPGERANALVAASINRQLTGRPVAQWERARLDEANVADSSCLRVEQYMRTDLFTVQPEDPVEIVANLMIWERLNYVPVEDKDHHLLGLVSRREMLRLLTSQRSMRETAVGQIMTPAADVLTCSPDTSTSEAIRIMRRFRVGGLPVIHEGCLVGIVTEEEFVAVAGRLLGADADADSEADAER
jgi:CBS domain-containing protein/gamma-glutamylcysteine synthetase